MTLMQMITISNTKNNKVLANVKGKPLQAGVPGVFHTDRRIVRNGQSRLQGGPSISSAARSVCSFLSIAVLHF